jgi:hypothetical protein
MSIRSSAGSSGPTDLALTRRGLGLLVAAVGVPIAATAKIRRFSPLLTDVPLAGDPYYAFRQVRDALSVGEALTLRREPTNPYDPLAVEVLTAADAKLGYVPRRRNEALARLMDAGVPVRGVVTLAGREMLRTGRGDERKPTFVFAFRIEAALG